AQPRGYLVAAYFDLLSRREVLHHDMPGGKLAWGEHHRIARTGLVGRAELLLHAAVPAAARGVLAVGAQAELAQLVQQRGGVAGVDRVDHDRVEPRRDGPSPFGCRALHREQDPLDARAEADRRRGRAAHLLAQPVVAAAAADRVLRAVDRGTLEL